jgi:hypothetical protein
MTTPLGFTHQQPTIDPIAPPPPPPPTPVNNTQAHPKADAKPVAAAAELLRNAARKFENHLSSINPAGLDQKRLHNEISAFADSPAAAQINEAIALATKREADAEARVAQVMKSLSPQGDTAQELRNTRVWERAARQLDSAHTNQVAEVARKLIANSSDDELGVLLTELPSYLDSQGAGSDWLEHVAAERVPELAAAKKAAKLAAQSRQIVTHDAGLLRGRIMNTSAPQSYTPVAFIPVGKYDPDVSP